VLAVAPAQRHYRQSRPSASGLDPEQFTARSVVSRRSLRPQGASASDTESEVRRESAGAEADTGGNEQRRVTVTDSLLETPFRGPIQSGNSDSVAHVAGITGRSSPAPEWWGRRPRRSFGTGEERPSSPAITDCESHSKAPPATSEVAKPSEVGWGRLLVLQEEWVSPCVILFLWFRCHGSNWFRVATDTLICFTRVELLRL